MIGYQVLSTQLNRNCRVAMLMFAVLAANLFFINVPDTAGQSSPQACILVNNNTCALNGPCPTCKLLFGSCGTVNCTFQNNQCFAQTNGGTCTQTLISIVAGQQKVCSAGSLNWALCGGLPICYQSALNDVAGNVYSC